MEGRGGGGGGGRRGTYTKFTAISLGRLRSGDGVGV